MQFTLVWLVRISVTLLTPTEIRVEWPPSKDNLASSRDSPSLLPFSLQNCKLGAWEKERNSLQCTTHTCRVIVFQWRAASYRHFSSVPSTNVREDLGFFHCCQLRDVWQRGAPCFSCFPPQACWLHSRAESFGLILQSHQFHNM